jgi:ubiquinone/menaquinone biosynthesis C-methylase UbiE
MGPRVRLKGSAALGPLVGWQTRPVHATPRERQARDDRHFDRWAARYDRSLAQSLLFGPVQRTVAAVLAARLPVSAALLDVGCGTGRLLDRLGSVQPGWSLFGVDRSTGMASAARRLRPSLRIVQGSAEALPYESRSFDAVVTTLSFHHWSDKPSALAEVFRVLRPGGLLALTDASVDDLPGRPRRLWALARRNMDDMPALRDRDLLLDGAGLRVLEVRQALHGRWVTLTLAERPAA